MSAGESRPAGQALGRASGSQRAQRTSLGGGGQEAGLDRGPVSPHRPVPTFKGLVMTVGHLQSPLSWQASRSQTADPSGGRYSAGPAVLKDTEPVALSPSHGRRSASAGGWSWRRTAAPTWPPREPAGTVRDAGPASLPESRSPPRRGPGGSSGGRVPCCPSAGLPCPEG